MTKYVCDCWDVGRVMPCGDCRPFPERENFGQKEWIDRVHLVEERALEDAYSGGGVDFPETVKAADPVRQPTHYTVGGIETIDYMAAKASPEEFRGHLRLTALKYLSRAGHKDDALQDYRKAAVYLDWLIKHLETGSHK